MARNSRNKTFTIFDVMEEKGVFSTNPANQGSFDPITKEQLYQGPVEYPKMFYHPQGEMRKTVEGEIIVTPLGAKVVGEQYELINTIAKNREEEESLRAEGWHDTQWKSLKAAGKDVSKIERSVASRPLSDPEKDSYIKALEAKLAALGQAPTDAPPGSSETKDALKTSGLID